MILIDTSVWIEFFRQKEPFLRAVRPLLKNMEVITVEPVFSELLYGVRNMQEKIVVESYWKVLPRIEFGAGSMLEASIFANSNDYHKLGIGLMDAIIIRSAQEGKHLLWTLDAKINKMLDQNLIFQPSNIH